MTLCGILRDKIKEISHLSLKDHGGLSATGRTLPKVIKGYREQRERRR